MKNKFLIWSLVFALIAVIVLLFAFPDKKAMPMTTETEAEKIGEAIPASEDTPTDTEPAAEAGEPEHSQAPEAEYQSPVDFAALQEQNPDIYAWLQIPGTDISYEVVQSASDDTFYLDHDSTGNPDSGGALYTEHKYNNTDFSDPVTVIYGHHLRSGKMFGNLQQYYSDDFEKYPELVIYTPSEEIYYHVFAAVEFSNKHILYYYDCFENKLMIEEFLDDLKSIRAFGSYVDKSVEIKDTDQLLVLSTCLRGDRTCRYLVIGKRIK